MNNIEILVFIVIVGFFVLIGIGMIRSIWDVVLASRQESSLKNDNIAIATVKLVYNTANATCFLGIWTTSIAFRWFAVHYIKDSTDNSLCAIVLCVGLLIFFMVLLSTFVLTSDTLRNKTICFFLSDKQRELYNAKLLEKENKKKRQKELSAAQYVRSK